MLHLRQRHACKPSQWTVIEALLASFEPVEMGDRISIGLHRALESMLGLRLREAEARRCVKRVLSTLGRADWSPKGAVVVVDPADRASLTGVLEHLAIELCRIALRPLTPRQLLEALPISNAERLRWTKDHRLPSSGTVRFRRGQSVSIPTYSVSVTERLLADPGIVRRWRETDISNGIRSRKHIKESLCPH